MAFFEFLAQNTCMKPSSRINNGEGVRPSGLYAINPYCRGMLCSHYTVGFSQDYYVTVVIVLGSGDPPVPTPPISSLVLLQQSFANTCSLCPKTKPYPVRGEGCQNTRLIFTPYIATYQKQRVVILSPPNMYERIRQTFCFPIISIQRFLLSLIHI